MPKAPRRFRALVVGLAIIAVMLAGYISNAITSRACERHTKDWLDQLMSVPTGWPGWPVGRGHSTFGRGEFWLPWIVQVDYSYHVSPRGMEQGTQYYFCFFGIPFELVKRTFGEAA
jgi:hypothetical protein